MGAFYTSHHIRANSTSRVIEALNGLITEPAFVSDVSGGWVSVFCEETESQAEEPIHSIGKYLSRELGAPVFAFLIHDSDIFCYWFYEQGNVRDEYNSCPDYFDAMMEVLDEQRSSDAKEEYRQRSRGQPEAVLPYGVPGTTLDILSAILDPTERYTFVEQQVADFGAFLGLNDDGRTQVGFKYISQGDGDFSHTLISPEQPKGGDPAPG